MLNKKNIRKWRLIVRNVSFECSENDIRNKFLKFGDIFEIQMPQKKGRFAGFCFVQFQTYNEAANAMKVLNGQEIKDRVVAVDWAIPKDQYMTAVIEEKRAVKDESASSKPEDDTISTENRVQKGKKSVKRKRTASQNPDQDDSDSNDSGDEADTIQGSSKVDDSREAKKPPIVKSCDVDEGKTLFVRGVPFDVTDGELAAEFEKFGALSYGLVCKFRDSDQSKGSGFVKFLDKRSADACLTCCNAGEGITLKGRRLTVCSAVSKSDVQKISVEKSQQESEPKDKRNLHLLRVGLIRAGTHDANGMSDQDSTKRVRIEASNRLKIKNLNIFVSPTRLVLHNLPTDLTDRQLRFLCLKTVNDKAAVIKECRIMRDRDRLNSQGSAKSRGFAFVEFENHANSLACLKKLNNNPDIFTNNKRPIVEFSLENRLALNAKAVRFEKSKIAANQMAETQSVQPKKVKINYGSKKRRMLFKPAVVPAAPDGPKKPFPSHIGPKIRTSKNRLKGTNKKKQRPDDKSKFVASKDKKLRTGKKKRKID